MNIHEQHNLTHEEVSATTGTMEEIYEKPTVTHQRVETESNLLVGSVEPDKEALKQGQEEVWADEDAFNQDIWL